MTIIADPKSIAALNLVNQPIEKLAFDFISRDPVNGEQLDKLDPLEYCVSKQALLDKNFDKSFFST